MSNDFILYMFNRGTSLEIFQVSNAAVLRWGGLLQISLTVNCGCMSISTCHQAFRL